MSKRIVTALLAMGAILIYSYFSQQLNFTQDDAYISYRYVENYLGGEGLVYNAGERVEGFTNFGWVVYLVFWGALGVSYVAASKVTGFVMGAAIILMTLLLARRLFDRSNWPFVWLAVFLVALNQSLAYWSPAGLETAAFSMAAMTSLYLYLRRSYLLTLAMVMGVLIRPEGVLVVLILIVVEAFETRRLPLFTGRCAALALIFCLPLAGFKLWYYGSLFPNPFYAKTGWTIKQLTDGLDYAARFFGHYGFYGLGLVVPLFFWKKMGRESRIVWMFTVSYLLYIVLIGGDVLKVHRFFLPLIGSSAVLISLSAWLLVRKLSAQSRCLLAFLICIPLFYFTVTFPRDYVMKYNRLEKQFTAKMSFMADNIASSDDSDFSVALSTIGIFGYRLRGHRVIDMVGLTDSTIARHEEAPIEGMASTWKERKHNSRYLLSQEPDYILFSTDMKPSAPSEKALMLYSQFLRGYAVVGWFDQHHTVGGVKPMRTVFKQVRPLEGDLTPVYPLKFVEYYKLGLESYLAGDWPGALRWYRKARDISPDPPYAYILYNMALCHLLMNEAHAGVALMDTIVARDSLVVLAHAGLYKHAMVSGLTDKAERHWYWLEATVPWLLPQLRSETAELLKQTRPLSP